MTTPTQPTPASPAANAAQELFPGEYAVEGAGDHEEMQSAYDYNERLIERRQEATAIIQKLLDEQKQQSSTLLRKKVDAIIPLLQRIAGNRKFMQVAGPAREALNILKADYPPAT